MDLILFIEPVGMENSQNWGRSAIRNLKVISSIHLHYLEIITSYTRKFLGAANESNLYSRGDKIIKRIMYVLKKREVRKERKINSIN